MTLFVLSFMILLYGLVLVGSCYLMWSILYSVYVSYKSPNMIAQPHDGNGWNYDHQFFETITEFRNDFSSK